MSEASEIQNDNKCTREKQIQSWEEMKSACWRHQQGDAELMGSLDQEYTYISTKLESILHEAMYLVIRHQPEKLADFLYHYMKNDLDASQYTRNDINQAHYIQRKVRPLMSLAITSAVKDHPENLQEYFANFFGSAITVY